MSDRDDMLLEALTGLINAQFGSLKTELNERFGKIDERFNKIDERLLKLEISVEHEIKPQLGMLCDELLSMKKTQEAQQQSIEEMKLDIAVLKQAVASHSEILKKIS